MIFKIERYMNGDEFQAKGFHQSLSGGRSSGTLSIEGQGIRFSCEEGGVLLPADGLRMRLGGSGNRYIFIEHDRFPEWSVYSGDHALLKSSELINHPTLSVVAASVVRGRRSQWFWLGTTVAVVLGLFIGLILAKPWLVAFLADQVPHEWEVQLGDSAFESYRTSLDVIDDPTVQALMAELTGALLEQVGTGEYNFRIHVVEDENINAFALPGGILVFHTAAIETAERPEELLGVLAHEVAHVTEKHGVKSMISSIGVSVLVGMFFDANSLLGLLQDAAPFLTRQKFSRDNEHEADSQGFAYLAAAHIDPQGMVEFFRKMQAEMGNTGKAAEALNILSTHPTSDARIERIESLIAEKEGASYRDLGDILDRLKAALNTTRNSNNPPE